MQDRFVLLLIIATVIYYYSTVIVINVCIVFYQEYTNDSRNFGFQTRTHFVTKCRFKSLKA